MEAAKKARGVLRQRTTKLLNQLEKALEEDNLVKDELEEILEQLESKNTSLNELNIQIQEPMDEDEIEMEIAVSEDYKEKIIKWRTKLNRAIKSLEAQRGDESFRSSLEAQDQPNRERNRGIRATVKLPHLTIPKFSGDFSCWQNFWGQFEASIHHNPALATVDKFVYLKSFLEGPALQAIGGYSLSDENYGAVVEKLHDRFGKKSQAVNSHMVTLLHLQPVRRATEVTLLRQLYDTCEIQVKSLEALGTTMETYGTFLYPILTRLLPQEILLDFNKNYADEEQDARHLLNHLKREVESREKTMVLCVPNRAEEEGRAAGVGRWSSHKSKHEPSYFKSLQNPKSRVPTTAVLKTAVSKTCLFCGSTEHPTEECEALSLEQKGEQIRNQNRCFLCLSQGHPVRRCTSKAKCQHCGRKHHASICRQRFNETSKSGAEKPDESEKHQEPEKRSLTMTTFIPRPPEKEVRRKLFLQTVVVYAEGRNTRAPVRCLFDGASEGTFVREDLVRSLKLPVVKEELVNVFAFGKSEPERVTRRTVKLTLRSVMDSNITAQIEALEVPTISGAIVTVPGECIRQQLDEKEITLGDMDQIEGVSVSQDVPILIGVDYFWSLNTGETRRLDNSLVAVKSVFGWSVHGVQNQSVAVNSIQVMRVGIQNEELAKSLKAFWEIESLGIKEENTHTMVEESVLASHEDTLEFEDGRYKTSLPWKDNKDKIGDNIALSTKRLGSLIKKLRHDPVLFQRYEDAINEMLARGFAERVPEENIAMRNGVHYLPHFPVLREDKTTTKLRVVHDASAHEKGSPALNSCLHVGPSLVPDLLIILLQFRQHRIALMSDVEKAFLQIVLKPEDRDYVRFLWITKLPKPDEPLQVVHLRMTRVLFGVASSPFLLAATLRHHFKKFHEQYPVLSEMLAKRLYVDDLVTGAESEHEANEIYHGSRQIFSEAGMNLRKWVTNCEELAIQWSEDQAPVTLLNQESNSNLLKVLGIAWNPKKDILTFDISTLLAFLRETQDTKRGVLKAAARLFDPIGLLSPYLIRVKCLFQKLWIKGVGWDDKLPSDILTLWNDWVKELKEFGKMSIPRWYYSGIHGKVVDREIHLFCDASESAYGAVAYIRYETDKGEIGVSLVSSKTRVAPIKSLTIPRLELMAAFIGSRLLKTTMESFEGAITAYRCWTDSEITLHWIRGVSREWKPFVANRVMEIQSSTNPNCWSHVAGKENPADLASRGCSVDTLNKTALWWKGPSWLSEKRDQWPCQSRSTVCTLDESVTKEKRNIITLVCRVTTEPLLDIKRYSRISRVYRVTAWVRRFIHNIRIANDERRKGPLSAAELQDSKLFWVREIQKESYPDDYHCLQAGEPLAKTSKLLQFRPFLDNDVIRLGGRLQFANISDELKHPLIIPANNWLTQIIAIEAHQRVKHCGLESTLAQLRGEFWIPQGRQLVKRVVNRCGRCRRFRTKPAAQITAPLPVDRIVETPPFATTGVDFAGPLFIRSGEEHEKAYIALYTCAVTRAVHLEAVTDLSTEKFILSFRRFIARRGLVTTVYSDNAKTFKRAEKELKTLYGRINEDDFRNFLGQQCIHWKYIVERAAWWGGFWERIVQSVKECLKKTLGRSSLTYEELTSSLAEIEAVLNSRPMTYTYTDLGEPSPLTPSHFLIGKRLSCLPSANFADMPPTACRSQLTRRLRYRQRILDQFWNRWSKAYLLDLKTAHASKPVHDVVEFKKDDIVLLAEPKLPRQSWRMGRIQEVFPGRDGKVRAVAVKLPGGSTIRRAVQMLHRFEVTDG